MNALAKQVYATASAIKVETQGGQPSMVVSTSALDRDSDRVDPLGGDFKNFLRNPVLCWAHAHSDIPIGTITHLSADASGIRMYWRWLENDPFADRVKNAFIQGVVRAASIGFLPIKASRNEYGGQDHTRWELVEISLCSVPANPEATRTLKSLGLWSDRSKSVHDNGEIDWTRINAELASRRSEVNVDSKMVDLVVRAMTPALVAGALALTAGEAAERALNHMTGRID